MRFWLKLEQTRSQAKDPPAPPPNPKATPGVTDQGGDGKGKDQKGKKKGKVKVEVMEPKVQAIKGKGKISRLSPRKSSPLQKRKQSNHAFLSQGHVYAW